jgi:hypothetical protein
VALYKAESSGSVISDNDNGGLWARFISDRHMPEPRHIQVSQIPTGATGAASFIM